MTMLDGMAGFAEQGWDSRRDDDPDTPPDNSEQDGDGFQATARIATAHMWPFLVSATTLDDYGNRRSAKLEEITYICNGIAPHIGSKLMDGVLSQFDNDFAAVWAHRQQQKKNPNPDMTRYAPFHKMTEGGQFYHLKKHGLSDDDVADLHHVHKQLQAVGKGGALVKAHDLLHASGPEVAHTHREEGEAPAPQHQGAAPDPSSSYEEPPTNSITPPAGPRLMPGGGQADPQNDEPSGERGRAPGQRAEHATPAPGLVSTILGKTPKVDRELEDPNVDYGDYTAGGMFLKGITATSASALDFDALSPPAKVAHIAHAHQVDPRSVQGMSPLGSAAMHQVLHDEAGLASDHYHPRRQGARERESWDTEPESWEAGPQDESALRQHLVGAHGIGTSLMHGDLSRLQRLHESDHAEIDGGQGIGSAPAYRHTHEASRYRSAKQAQAGLEVDTFGHVRWHQASAPPPPIQMDGYGHIVLSAYDPRNDPQVERRGTDDADDEPGDPDEDEYEAPEQYGPVEMGNWRGGVHQRNPKTSAKRMNRQELAQHLEERHAFYSAKTKPTMSLGALHKKFHDSDAESGELQDHTHMSYGQDNEYEGVTAPLETDPNDPSKWAPPRRSRGHLGAEEGTEVCPICHEKIKKGEMAEHMRKEHHVKDDDDDDDGPKGPGAASAGNSKAKPSAGRQTHKQGGTREAQLVRAHAPSPGEPPLSRDELVQHMTFTHGYDGKPFGKSRGDLEAEHAKYHPGEEQAPERVYNPPDFALASRRSPQRPLQGSQGAVAPETGYDPGEVFGGYYGGTQPPRRTGAWPEPGKGYPHRSQPEPEGGPTPGLNWQDNEDERFANMSLEDAVGRLRQEREKSRGERQRQGAAPLTGNSDLPPDPESGTGASGLGQSSEQVDMPGGNPAQGDMSQSDAPQDIQSQLGQLPALGHRVGAKVAEIASDILATNPHLTAGEAMTLSLKTLKFWPRVAFGGADYITTEPEVLTACPQCQRQAYNRDINRCHSCGWYDAGLEPAIEVT